MTRSNIQISHKNRTSLQNNTNYFNTIHTLFHWVLRQIYFFHQAVKYADFKDKHGELYLKVNFIIFLIIIAMHCFTSKDTREHDECKVYLKTLWRSKNLKTLRGGNSTWKKLMDVKIQFNLPFNLPYNIHSNIVKLCPNKTSPVFNVDHDTELLNFYSYIGEVSCCMKMCCHIFAAPAVSTHYVVFDSFFWWKKCASMWCMSALWVGWWTFGSCLVIFGLISFWPTLGIFGERQSSVIPITPSQWALTKSAMGSFLKEKVPFNIGQK